MAPPLADAKRGLGLLKKGLRTHSRSPGRDDSRPVCPQSNPFLRNDTDSVQATPRYTPATTARSTQETQVNCAQVFFVRPARDTNCDQIGPHPRTLKFGHRDLEVHRDTGVRRAYKNDYRQRQHERDDRYEEAERTRKSLAFWEAMAAEKARSEEMREKNREQQRLWDARTVRPVLSERELKVVTEAEEVTAQSKEYFRKLDSRMRLATPSAPLAVAPAPPSQSRDRITNPLDPGYKLIKFETQFGPSAAASALPSPENSQFKDSGYGSPSQDHTTKDGVDRIVASESEKQHDIPEFSVDDEFDKEVIVVDDADDADFSSQDDSVEATLPEEAVAQPQQQEDEAEQSNANDSGNSSSSPKRKYAFTHDYDWLCRRPAKISKGRLVDVAGGPSHHELYDINGVGDNAIDINSSDTESSSALDTASASLHSSPQQTAGAETTSTKEDKPWEEQAGIPESLNPSDGAEMSSGITTATTGRSDDVSTSASPAHELPKTMLSGIGKRKGKAIDSDFAKSSGGQFWEYQPTVAGPSSSPNFGIHKKRRSVYEEE
jgi:hypothetical protein